MAEGRTFQAKIELMGKIHASLSGAVKMAQNQLNRLGNVAKKMGAGIGAGFAKLGGMVKSFAGQVIGLTLAFAGLRSAAEFIGKAKDEFKANQEAAAALNAILANNPKIVKMGAKELENQQKRLGDLADQMQEASVYSGAMWREAFGGLAQWGAGAADAEKLSGAINDMLAAKSGLKATASEAKALGDQLGKAVKTGKLGTLKKEFGLDKKDEQRFAKMRSSAERIAELNRIVASKYGGRARALGETDAGRMRQAENRIADFQSRMGEGFLEIELQWKEAVARMIPGIEPFIEATTRIAGKGFDVLLDLIEDLSLEWEYFTLAIKDPEFIKSWDKLKDVSERVLKPIAEAIGPIVTKITELLGFKPELGIAGVIQQEIEDTANFINKIGKAIDRVLDFVDDMTLSFEAFMIDLASLKLPDWLTNFKLPEFKWPELPGWLKEGEKIKAAEVDFGSVNSGLATVKTAVDAVGAAFNVWSVPQALLSGLQTVISKTGEAIAAFGSAEGKRIKGIGEAAPAPAPSVHKRGMPTGQHGGIFSSPTIIGEAGPEAAIPLHGGQGPLDLLNQAANALGVGRRSTSVNYAPNFTVNGAGPEAARSIERIVRRSHDELLREIEALDGEMMRRAFV
jgi:hypothetical protein